jgi:hypothetical protein
MMGIFRLYALVCSTFSMMGAGLSIFCRKMCRLKKYGSETLSSCEMKLFVGTEKTSVRLLAW